jgi:lysophospholipase L1-like esterase
MGRRSAMKVFQRALLTSSVCMAMLAAQHPAAAATIDPEKAKPSADGKMLWYDCKDIGVEGKGWAETNSFYDRLPGKAEKAVPEKDWRLSHHSAGMYVQFSSNSETIQVRWTLSSADLAMPHMPATGVSGVDLYVRNKSGQWQFLGNGRPHGKSNSASFWSPNSHEFRLYLPLYNGIASIEIGIPKEQSIAALEKPANRPKPIVWYGHSITQGGCASRPGMASLNIAGRALNREIVNLGFSGSGKMEIELADLVAELDASVFVLDCMGNMSKDEVTARVEPFVKKLRAAHPDTPIVLVDEAQVRNEVPTQNGRLLRTEFEKLKADKNLHFLSADRMLGEDGEGTVDGVHPNDLGMQRQADAFVKSIAAVLGNKP